jgi:hypothetical protein
MLETTRKMEEPKNREEEIKMNMFIAQISSKIRLWKQTSGLLKAAHQVGEGKEGGLLSSSIIIPAKMNGDCRGRIYEGILRRTAQSFIRQRFTH